MSQKLILPINHAYLTASIDTDTYTSKFGFEHYGCDLISTKADRTVYASGTGQVKSAGWDNVCGNVIIIVYDDVYNHSTEKTLPLTMRYFHLQTILVTPGQRVTKDTKIGVYGNTGRYVTGSHLHVEADTDTVYVRYTPSILSSNLLQGIYQGAYPFSSDQNTVVNPLSFFHIKASAPDNQTFLTAQNAFISANDQALPQF